MQITTSDPQTFLLQRIQEDRRRTEGISARLRRLEVRLVAAILLTTTAAAAIAGLTAAAGPLVGSGPSAWRWTCGLIAVLTALSGFLTGAQQRFQISERLGRALACAGRLRALEIALGISKRDLSEIARDYEELVAQYAEFSGP